LLPGVLLLLLGIAKPFMVPKSPSGAVGTEFGL